MDEIQVNVEFVDKHYIPTSDTEEILYGFELKNGMIVVIESPDLREDTESISWLRRSVELYRQSLERNRWCKVTKFLDDGNAIRFVGEYIDGTKFARFYDSTSTWVVKKESILAVKAAAAAKKAYEDLRDDKTNVFDWRAGVEKVRKMTDKEYQDFLDKGPYYKNKIEEIDVNSAYPNVGILDEPLPGLDGSKDFSGYKIDYTAYKAHDNGTVEETMRVLHEEPTEAEKSTTTDN